MRAVVIINPVSGPSRRRPVGACKALATEAFVRHGAEVEVLVTSAPGEARLLAARARNAGVDLVAAWGGDGTINEVASALRVLGDTPGNRARWIGQRTGSGPGRAARISGGARTGRDRLASVDRCRAD